MRVHSSVLGLHRAQVCVKLELFNVLMDDLTRSYVEGASPSSANESSVKARSKKPRGWQRAPHSCSRVSHWINRYVGCLNVTVPPLASSSALQQLRVPATRVTQCRYAPPPD